MKPQDSNTEELIQLLRNANKSLLRRMIALTAIIIIGVGFFLEDWREHNHRLDLIDAQSIATGICQSDTPLDLIDSIQYSRFYNVPNTIDLTDISVTLQDSLKAKDEICDSLTKHYEQAIYVLNNKEHEQVNILGFSLTYFVWRIVSAIVLAFLFFNFSSILKYRDKIMFELKEKSIEGYRLGAEQFDIFMPYEEYNHSVLPSIQSILFTVFLLALGFTAFAISFGDIRELDNGVSVFLLILNGIIAVLINVHVVIILYRQNLIHVKTFSLFIYCNDWKNTARQIVFLRRCLLTILLATVFFAQWRVSHSASILSLVAFIASIVILPISIYIDCRHRNNVTRSLLYTGVALTIFWSLRLMKISDYSNGEDILGNIIVVILIFFLSCLLYLYSMSKKSKEEH